MVLAAAAVELDWVASPELPFIEPHAVRDRDMSNDKTPAGEETHKPALASALHSCMTT